MKVLDAGGLNPSPANQQLRALKSAWEVYLTAAFAIGLFDGMHGGDLKARLIGPNEDNFRSAMSECLAAWYLAGRRKLSLKPRPNGRTGRLLEFVLEVADGDINVEVKAPHQPTPTGGWWVNDDDVLRRVMEDANKQFAKGARNLLVIVPELPALSDRYRLPLEQAFIGETVISIPIDRVTGGPAGPTTFPFKQAGRFVQTWPTETGQRQPRFTRIGAMLCLIPYIDDAEIKHRAYIVHNPNAANPLPRELWDGIPEFSFRSGQWKWSDDPAASSDQRPSVWDVLHPDSEWLKDPEQASERALRNARER